MWRGAPPHEQFYQALQLRNIILLDSESTSSIFCNSKFVTDIRKTNEELEQLTNGGPLKTKLKATVPGFGLVWYDPNSIANISAMVEMEDWYRITYDPAKELTLIIRLPNKQVKFTGSFGKLNCYTPKYKTRNVDKWLALINAVSENKGAFTDWQCQLTKKAEELHDALIAFMQ